MSDLFRIEDVGMCWGGPYAFSADGKQLAFTRIRAAQTLKNFRMQNLWGNAGGDVWVQSQPQSAPFRITRGLENNSGWWAPEWSPDGRRLAMLSTEGGNVHLWVWDATSHRLEQVEPLPVGIGPLNYPRPYFWLDNRRLGYMTLQADDQPLPLKSDLLTAQIATRAWAQMAAGREATASELDGGADGLISVLQSATFVVTDTEHPERSHSVQEGVRFFQWSPTKAAVLLVLQPSATEMPRADVAIGFGLVRLADLRLFRSGREIIRLTGPADVVVREETLRWSPDEKFIAFVGSAAEREAARIYRVAVESGDVETQPGPSADVRQLEWTYKNDLVVYGGTQWSLLSPDGKSRLLTGRMHAVPERLIPGSDRRTFVGLADGAIWAIDEEGAVTRMTDLAEGQVAGIAWPVLRENCRRVGNVNASYSQVLFYRLRDGERQFSLLDLTSGISSPVAKPSPSADLFAYSPPARRAVFASRGDAGLHVWSTSVDQGSPVELISANLFLAGIDRGRYQLIEYVGLNGEHLKGWLLLPPGYRPDTRYPMVTWVYPGSTFSAESPATAITSSALTLEVLSARGYIVLEPSMPLAPEGERGDPMLQLPTGVLPAVDEAIRLGFADPERLYLMGQSYGGYATFGLITQTNRFKAAVALAGPTNLVSLYGEFQAGDRYTEWAHEQMFAPQMLEAGQGRMAAPPWRDLGRYLRNSPISYVDRVNTPLMIMQGDMDYVPIQQGEEFFTSLYRQGKRVRFVRYWGEGHVLQSPANIEDMWKRIFAWFDEFSPSKSMPAQPQLREAQP